MNKAMYPSLPVLLVDDEITSLQSFEIVLRTAGIRNTICCQDSRDVMPLLLRQEIGVMLLDLTMPHISGEELLPMITQDYPEILVIIITGRNEVDTAVKCMKANAFDYMVKPVEKSRLVSGVKRAIELWELQQENKLLRQSILSDRLSCPEAFSKIVTKNKTMFSLFQYVESVAKTNQPVLITGETGVGKELFAEAVHTLSNRQGLFVRVNVAGIDDNTFSDTLFGHIKGAFTGANEIRRGLTERASGGTLLLDEIGDLSHVSQIKLLRLVQEREYFPLGSDLPKGTDARIIITTNLDLEALQKSGRFRKDLYYRVCTHQIQIPPLRERMGDLPFLVDHFLEVASKSLGKKKPKYPPELITLLANHYFQGNVRELQTMIFDAVSEHKSKMLSMKQFKKHIYQKNSSQEACSIQFPFESTFSFAESEPLPTLQQANDLLVAEAIKRSNNNQSMAAKLLGISRQRLIRHLKSIRK